jgi:SagB-type dehydrogenase family enzyme
MNHADLSGILAYHRQSKHAPGRYARSAGFMDWANQPDPFRHYRGAAVVPLPLDSADPQGDAPALFLHEGRRPYPLELTAVAKLLELSLGLSAWKSIGGSSRWALRMNPSSGNLHPTECHLLLPSSAGGPGLFHYCPLTHALERRAVVSPAHWRQLRSQCGGPGFLVALASIHWRESWKYGERAFRYCHHDVGHALAALALTANLLGWRMRLIGGLAASDIDRLLGLDRCATHRLEEEHADLACWIGPQSGTQAAPRLDPELLAALAALDLQGQPNLLSPSAVDWEAIGAASAHSAGLIGSQPLPVIDPRPFPLGAPLGLAAAEVIRRRRSATEFDPAAEISQQQLRALLDRTLPRCEAAPFDVGLGAPAIHLLLFLHRVRGLKPGLYLLLRHGQPDSLVEHLAADCLWQPAMPGLPLFRLRHGDLRALASRLSCNQAIAGDSAFSLGMLADFDRLADEGPAAYRRLYWEAGMIGQVLYLEAESQGLRGTGIGCFFDDAVHQAAGLRSERWQSIYHFTVGHPLEDPRLTTLPPYHEVARWRRQIHGT